MFRVFNRTELPQIIKETINKIKSTLTLDPELTFESFLNLAKLIIFINIMLSVIISILIAIIQPSSNIFNTIILTLFESLILISIIDLAIPLALIGAAVGWIIISIGLAFPPLILYRKFRFGYVGDLINILFDKILMHEPIYSDSKRIHKTTLNYCVQTSIPYALSFITTIYYCFYVLFLFMNGKAFFDPIATAIASFFLLVMLNIIFWCSYIRNLIIKELGLVFIDEYDSTIPINQNSIFNKSLKTLIKDLFTGVGFITLLTIVPELLVDPSIFFTYIKLYLSTNPVVIIYIVVFLIQVYIIYLIIEKPDRHKKNEETIMQHYNIQRATSETIIHIDNQRDNNI